MAPEIRQYERIRDGSGGWFAPNGPYDQPQPGLGLTMPLWTFSPTVKMFAGAASFALGGVLVLMWKRKRKVSNRHSWT